MESDKHDPAGENTARGPASPVTSLAAFAAQIGARGALLGVDPGEKRLGLAICDPSRTIASPLDTITRRRFVDDASELWRWAESRKAVGLVIGLPLNMDGSEGPSAQSARAFAANLFAQRPVPILLWDERLSTAAVQRAMIAADASRARRGRSVDQAAAAYVLQGVIDALANAAPPSA